MSKTTTVTTEYEFDKEGRMFKEVKTTVESESGYNPFGGGHIWDHRRPPSWFTYNGVRSEGGTVLDLTTKIHDAAVSKAVKSVSDDKVGGYL